MTIGWPGARNRSSASPAPSASWSSASTRLCAETLHAIADPLFPALAQARAVAPPVAARIALRAMVEAVDTPDAEESTPSWLLPHQAEAVRRAHAIMRRFGGVLVADGAGLGKTFIGLGLAELERGRGGEALAVVPAALREEWRRAADDAGVDLTVVTHSALAGIREAARSRATLVIVDEAHAFRNPATRRYAALADAAVGRRVALLSATPYNNGPGDLAALIHLFAPRDGFRAFGVTDLHRALARGERHATMALAAVTVCRSRRLVERRFPDLRGAFPRRRLLPAVRYNLDATYDGRLRELLALLPAVAADGGPLLHLGLLRRLESSPAALRRSLLRQRDFLLEAQRAAAEGVTLSRRSFGSSVPRGEDDDVQLVWWSLLARPESAGLSSTPSVQRSLLAVEEALTVLNAGPETPGCARVAEGAAPAAVDPKAGALVALLDGALAGRKVIVFTEYRDTALALLRRLAGRFRAIAVAGSGARTASGVLTRDEALDAFAPIGRRARANPLLEADVLIATDIAGEGLNLQDADAVVNYDLPWNPVRVMQRVGRIDRLGSPHRDVHVAHLLPAGGLADLAGVLRRVRRKLDAATAAPGAEPDPLAALWWIESARLTPETIEEESWRRVRPFEARERWHALVGRRRRRCGPVVSAGIAADDGPPALALLLALEWPDRRRVMLPYAAEAGLPPVRDAEALGNVAERALHAVPIGVDATRFAAVLASVLPDARNALLELSAARYGTEAMGAGRAAAVERLQVEAAAAARRHEDLERCSYALDLLGTELPAGLDARLSALMERRAPGPAAANIVNLLEPFADGLRAERDARPSGRPRIRLVAAIAVAARCPSPGTQGA